MVVVQQGDTGDKEAVMLRSVGVHATCQTCRVKLRQVAVTMASSVRVHRPTLAKHPVLLEGCRVGGSGQTRHGEEVKS